MLWAVCMCQECWSRKWLGLRLRHYVVFKFVCERWALPALSSPWLWLKHCLPGTKCKVCCLFNQLPVFQLAGLQVVREDMFLFSACRQKIMLWQIKLDRKFILFAVYSFLYTSAQVTTTRSEIITLLKTSFLLLHTHTCVFKKRKRSIYCKAVPVYLNHAQMYICSTQTKKSHLTFTYDSWDVNTTLYGLLKTSTVLMNFLHCKQG